MTTRTDSYVVVLRDIYSATVHRDTCDVVSRAKPRKVKTIAAETVTQARNDSFLRIANRHVRFCGKCMVERKADPTSNLTKTDFARIWREADAAGDKAGTDISPPLFRAVEHENPLDDSSPVKKVYPEPFELCGFAWITVRPGTSRFARWLKAEGHGRSDSYRGGVMIWMSKFNQSYERKYAAARAMAEVFRKHGITAHADGRLD